MTKQNNGVVTAQGADSSKKNQDVQNKIADITAKLTSFQELESLVNQRRALEVHHEQIKESIKEMKDSKFTDETAKNEVSQITLKLSNSNRYDGYTIKNAFLLKEVLDFLSIKFQSKLNEIDSEILSK